MRPVQETSAFESETSCSGLLSQSRCYKSILTIAVLAIPLSLVAAGKSVLFGDVTIMTHIQGVAYPGTVLIVDGMNWFGRVVPMAVLGGAIALALASFGRYREAGFVITAALLSHLANGLLKLAFSSPRPSGDLVTAPHQASGFGFPSGHTMSTEVFVGALVFLLLFHLEWRWLRFCAPVAGLVIVLCMGFSRIYVGAHWPSDVLGAYLWGAIFLLGLILTFQRFSESVANRSVPMHQSSPG